MPDETSSASYSTEAPAVAMIFASVELTKLVLDGGAKASAENVAANYTTIYKAVTHAWNNPRG